MFAHCRLFGILQHDLIFTKLELQSWNACLHCRLPFSKTTKTKKKKIEKKQKRRKENRKKKERESQGVSAKKSGILWCTERKSASAAYFLSNQMGPTSYHNPASAHRLLAQQRNPGARNGGSQQLPIEPDWTLLTISLQHIPRTSYNRAKSPPITQDS